jgi:ABC-type lipoprotein release transport system permease subunit
MGVRLALGAAPASLTRLILQRGMRHAALGAVIGLGLAAFESRWLGAMLYDVDTADPPTLAIALVALLAIAALASWVPGLRASRIKPIEALSGN